MSPAETMRTGADDEEDDMTLRLSCNKNGTRRNRPLVRIMATIPTKNNGRPSYEGLVRVAARSFQLHPLQVDSIEYTTSGTQNVSTLLVNDSDLFAVLSTCTEAVVNLRVNTKKMNVQPWIELCLPDGRKRLVQTQDILMTYHKHGCETGMLVSLKQLAVEGSPNRTHNFSDIVLRSTGSNSKWVLWNDADILNSLLQSSGKDGVLSIRAQIGEPATLLDKAKGLFSLTIVFATYHLFIFYLFGFQLEDFGDIVQNFYDAAVASDADPSVEWPKMTVNGCFKIK